MNNIDLKTITPNANITVATIQIDGVALYVLVFVSVCEKKTNKIESDEWAGEQTNKRNENRKYPTLFVRLINHHMVKPTIYIYNYTLHSMADDDGILLTAVVIFSPEKKMGWSNIFRAKVKSIKYNNVQIICVYCMLCLFWNGTVERHYLSRESFEKQQQ